jgi:membrane-associated phospholipid phosphatase
MHHEFSPRRWIMPVTLCLLAGMVVAAGFALDPAVTRWVLEANHGHWSGKPAVLLLSRFGDWPELMGFGLVGFLSAHLLRNVRWQRLFLAAMIASTLAGMVVNASRLTTGRTRPRAVADQGWYGPRHGEKWLVGEADFNSFPSGHTATAFGFAGIFLFAGPISGGTALAAAGAVALSRILLGAHHPSDVAVAMVIALAVSWAVWEFLGKRGRLDFRSRKEIPPVGRQAGNRIRERT